MLRRLVLLCSWRLALTSVCVAELKAPGLQGSCREAGQDESMHDADEEVKKQIKAEVQCISEIVANGYTIRSLEGHGPMDAIATPVNGTCSNGEFEEKYTPVRLTCAKTLSEFPNSCSGKSMVGEVHFAIAFYAFRQAVGDKSKMVLETAIVLGGDHLYAHPKRFICSGSYSLLSGHCLGLTHDTIDQESAERSEGPPEPPQIGWFPFPFPMVGYPATQCTAKQTTAEGPEFSCEVDSDFAKCQHECAGGYQISWPEDQPWEKAVAKPEKEECSVAMEDALQKRCATVDLTCNRSFGEFPNACAGYYITSLGKVWVAFYAFRRDMGAKAFRDVLETRIFLNPENNGTCADSYLVGTSGFCFGLPPSSNFVNGPAIDPPLLPKILDGAPDWPPVPDPRYAPEPAKEWPDLTWLLYLVCSLAVVALLLGAFLLRRRRRLEEARRLNDAQEVEIGGAAQF